MVTLTTGRGWILGSTPLCGRSHEPVRLGDLWNLCDVMEDAYDSVLNVNHKAVFFVTQAWVRHRQHVRGGGRVINISSVHDELAFRIVRCREHHRCIHVVDDGLLWNYQEQ
jgi:NAD(P)-dependent dehydrogenase (short-subunit alcohol dehydrogenase family)